MAIVRACGVLLLAVCLVQAKKKPAPHTDEGILGVVVRKTPDSLLIRTPDIRFVTFKIADTTLYFHGSKWASPARLKRGAVVRVDNDADREGVLTATEITFEDRMPEMQRAVRASDLLPAGTTTDALIQRAREVTDRFFKMLPNFVCQQSTTRGYAGADRQWRNVDQITAEVVYDHAKESYRGVKLNGRPTGGSMMDLPGSRSTGEFGSSLRALFDKHTEALFKFHSNATLRGFSTAVYDFAVSGELSDWRITAGSQSILTPYTGRIWIDRVSGNVVRIEKHATRIPPTFPFQRVEAEVDYGPVVLHSGRYFLPEHAQNVSCNDPKSCSRNVIEFRNYHKYIGESSISFDEPPEPDSP
jgi:hypothetical protein